MSTYKYGFISFVYFFSQINIMKNYNAVIIQNLINDSIFPDSYFDIIW